jgi:hypothetical protein
MMADGRHFSRSDREIGRSLRHIHPDGIPKALEKLWERIYEDPMPQVQDK